GTERLPRPTPVPSDLQGTEAPRQATPPPLPPRRGGDGEIPAAAEAPAGPEAEPIPLERRVERELEGLSPEYTLRLEGVVDQIEITRLAGSLEQMPIPHETTLSTETRFDAVYVVHSPGERPAFSIMAEGIVNRMAG